MLIHILSCCFGTSLFKIIRNCIYNRWLLHDLPRYLRITNVPNSKIICWQNLLYCSSYIANSLVSQHPESQDFHFRETWRFHCVFCLIFKAVSDIFAHNRLTDTCEIQDGFFGSMWYDLIVCPLSLLINIFQNVKTLDC